MVTSVRPRCGRSRRACSELSKSICGFEHVQAFGPKVDRADQAHRRFVVDDQDTYGLTVTSVRNIECAAGVETAAGPSPLRPGLHLPLLPSPAPSPTETLGQPSCSGLSAEGGLSRAGSEFWPCEVAAPIGCGTGTSILARIAERSASGAKFRGAMAETEHLRVLIANEKRDRLELLAQVVAGLGHEVIAREIYVKEVGAVTAREQPDVALVGRGSSSEHALKLISEIFREAACPVIAILHAGDPVYIHEAASAASSPTAPTAPATSCRARSTPPCNASPSTRACKGHSADVR